MSGVTARKRVTRRGDGNQKKRNLKKKKLRRKGARKKNHKQHAITRTGMGCNQMLRGLRIWLFIPSFSAARISQAHKRDASAVECLVNQDLIGKETLPPNQSEPIIDQAQSSVSRLDCEGERYGKKGNLCFRED